MNEFAFIIDKELSTRLQTLVLRVGRSMPNGAFEPLVLLDSSKVKNPLLLELFQEEAMFRKREQKQAPSPYSFFRIQGGKAYTLLQKLALEKLFFENKPITCDFFSKLTLSYSAVHEAHTVFVSATIITKTGTFAFSECDLIGHANPCFVIRKNFLYFFDENVSWSHLKAFLNKTHLTCSREEFERLREDLQEDGFSISIQNETPSSTILPVLQLTDRIGAFGELFMDYGNGKLVPFHEDPFGKKDSFRDKKQEALWEQDLLECGYQKKGHEYTCPVSDVAKTLDLLLDIGWKVRTFEKKELERLQSASFDIHEENSHFAVSGKATFQTKEIDAVCLASYCQSDKRFIPLSEHRVGLLYTERKDLIAFAELSKEILLVEQQAVIKKSSLGVVLHAAEHSSIRLHQKESAPIYTNLFQGSLYPYQQHAVSWFKQVYEKQLGALLADDMGLGKTVQVLAFLATLGTQSRTLIVVPTSLLFNWEKEIQVFFPQAKLAVYYGKSRMKESVQHATIVLTSYGILRKEYALFQEQLFHTIVLDEAQMVKNSSSQIAQMVQKLRASFRISMTGTPIENSLDELYAHFQFLIPDLLQKDEMQPHSIRTIQKKIKPFVLRRRKEEVALDLPEKIEQEVLLEMGDDEKEHYESILASFKKGLLQKISVDGAHKHSMEILEAILRLRQTACHPALSGLSQEMHASCKFESVTNDLETILENKKKAIVFSQFASMLAHFAKHAQKKNWNYLLLDGSTQNRKEIIEQFQTDPEQRLLFMSLKAGGVGLNLTAADYVLLYEPWWNEAVEQQAYARAHRIGRRDTVIIKRYIVKDTIEEAIQKLKASKKALSQSILDDNAPITSLSSDELFTLVNA
jgi:superfamily II DNA or RNA helicase